MEKEITNLNLRLDIKNRAKAAIKNGYFDGVQSLSGLVEKSLADLMDKKNVPKKFDK